MTPRRKLAIASWAAPQEGNIYGKLTVNADNALRYIEHLRASTGEKVTITTLVGKAAGMALAQAPSLNGRILFDAYKPYDTVDLAFLVALEEGKNLAKAKICQIDKKSISEITKELRALAVKLQRGEDNQFKKSQGPLSVLPVWLIRPLVRFTGWLTGALGVDMPAFGLEAHPFGSCVVTSVGMFGLDEGYAPPTPWAHVPVWILVGAVRERPAVKDGQIVIRNELTLCATIDHRFIDGFQGGILAKVVRQVLEEPWKADGLDKAPWD